MKRTVGKESNLIAILLKANQLGKYRLPAQLLYTRDPVLIGTYIAAMRYATTANEVTGSIAQYMRFLGYKPRSITASHNMVQRINKAIASLVNMKYFKTTNLKKKTYTLQQAIYLPFAAQKGWRLKPSSLDTVFTFAEIEHASEMLQRQPEAKDHIYLTHILYVAAFLRSQSDIAMNLAKKGQYARVSVLNFDDTAKTLEMSPEKLFIILRQIRSCKLGTFRVVTLIPKKGGIARIRFLLYSKYGRTTNTTLTGAFKHLRKLYNDYTLVAHTTSLAVNNHSHETPIDNEASKDTTTEMGVTTKEECTTEEAE